MKEAALPTITRQRYEGALDFIKDVKIPWLEFTVHLIDFRTSKREALMEYYGLLTGQRKSISEMQEELGRSVGSLENSIKQSTKHIFHHIDTRGDDYVEETPEYDTQIRKRWSDILCATEKYNVT